MKLPSHLKISRHGIYYFRTIIPKVIRPLYDGKTELKYSLHTRDPVTARRQAYILSAQTAHIFSKARLTMIRHDPKDFNPFDQSTWPTSKESANSWEVLLPNGMTIKTDPNNPDDQKNCLEALEKIGRLFPSTSSAQVAEVAPARKYISLSVAIELFVIDRALNKGVVESTKKSEARKLEHFLKWTNDPHDPPIDTITSDTIESYFTYLLNVGKKKHSGAELSKTTVNTYRAFLNVFFVYLKSKKHFPIDKPIPTTDTKIFAKGERKKTQEASRYQPFNPRELALIFKPEHLKNIKEPHEFWVPLLCLYTGARINEVCQLFIYDVKQSDEGFYFIDFHHFDGNTLKNGPSKRKSPIHGDLIALGFLDYVADVNALVPYGHLFPYLNYSEGDGFAAGPSKHFGYYLDRAEINIRDPKKVCHSFRSTLIQRLQDKSVTVDHIENLIGHAGDGTLGKHYGKQLSIEQLQQLVVSKINFPEVRDNLDALKYTKGEYTGMLKNTLKIYEHKLKNKKAKEERAARATASLGAKNKGK